MSKSLPFSFLLILFLIGCKKEEQKSYKFTNSLIKETSPYLLQHAHNPVNWYAWNEETLEKAKKENKLLLISVGYAACHWCHVMEHESFEDETVAKLMNTHFINIKIDREERPDIDQVYMNAVQLMTGSGGWPLNCVALPDGKPFWGGTYFTKDDWVNTLTQIIEVYQNNPEKIVEYAAKLTEGIKQSELIEFNSSQPVFSNDTIKKAIAKWSTRFDRDLGGMIGAPKFPMPNNYNFLMRFAKQSNDLALEQYVFKTLDKMALGGVFDHVNGGFSRYSTDDKWHIPHFEKMLYDNAQLVSLYSDAYLITKNDLYKDAVQKTLKFISRELTSREGAFYSSLDADSKNENDELEEGAYYIWKEDELRNLIHIDFDLFAKYYNINSYGLWENTSYHLIRKESAKEFAVNNNISLAELSLKVEKWNKILSKAREEKTRPRLDDKTLTSWNALMLKGYIDAYRVFRTEAYLACAIRNAEFIEENQLFEKNRLNHNYKNGVSNINGYLEDYATVIDAFLSLYEVTLDQKWLLHSKALADYCYQHFYDSNSKMFFFTSDLDTELITRKMEITDNVIPASNSMMAKNLFKLSHYYHNNTYRKTSEQMLHNVSRQFSEYPSGYSNWLDLYLNFAENFYEVAVVGDRALDKISEINQTYLPNKLIAGSVVENAMPLLQNRYVKNNTLIYVCVDGACNLPTDEVLVALKQMK